jgi:hypothetical protein
MVLVHTVRVVQVVRMQLWTVLFVLLVGIWIVC